jgi:hypothetical protein
MGRFLIDVPAGSRLSGGNYKYDFIAIEPVKAMTHEAFTEKVGRLEPDLRSAKNGETHQSMLLQSVQPENDTRVLASWKADFSADVISVYGYRWINGKRFLFQKDVDGDKQERGIARVQQALYHLRSRAGTDIPTDPGSPILAIASQAASSPIQNGKTKKPAPPSVLPATPTRSYRSGSTRSRATGTTNPCSNEWAA